MLWAESQRHEWADDEAAAFAVVALVLGRLLGSGPHWADELERLARQQRLEHSAALTRHLTHDFGNILTGIMGFTELAQAQQVPISAPLHSYLNEIYRAAQAGAQFTQQLRLFSRRQATPPMPSPLPLALSGVGQKLRAIRDAGHQLVLDVPEALPQVGLGLDSLQNVLGALLDNAREAMTLPGTVSLSAREAQLDEADCRGLFGTARPGPHLEIVVADTGPGLSPEAQQKLFDEPFFSTKSRRKGFGLAVSYGILAAYHGGIRLYPGAERGALARVVIPASGPVTSMSLPVGAMELSPLPSGQRVLVVDDQQHILDAVSALLRQAGYRVQPFVEGEAALEAYFSSQGNDPFSLVLTDVVMPGLSGVELARRLFRRDPSARVVFMSGKVSNDFTRQDFGGRHFEFVHKPFRTEDLLSAVRTSLGRPGKAAPSGGPGAASPLLPTWKS
jgi:signal transduction histidine kinase/CheY-like chemotaxis protein